jgi:hypothetical protein
MKYKHLFWAIILIAIGLLFILRNFGVLHFSWFSFWKLWPVILIFWGIAILPIRDVIKYVLLGIVLVLTFLFIDRLTERSWFFDFGDRGNRFHWRWDKEDRTGSTNYKDQNLVVSFDSLTVKGILRMDAAAGNFTVKGLSSDLLSFSKTGDIGNYELTTREERKGVKAVSLRLQEGSSTRNIKKNQVDIRLNSKPAWDLDLDIGAAEMDLDLSDYCIDTVSIDAGASAITLKLGDKSPLTILTFSAGASSINVEIPKESGCQFTSDSFLASRSFTGFSKKGDHTWETENFATAKNKIFITVKTAVSSIEIRRY